MYCFDRTYDIWIKSLSKVISIIGTEIMPPALPYVYMVLVINIEEFTVDLQVVSGIACGAWFDLTNNSKIICSNTTSKLHLYSLYFYSWLLLQLD